MKVTIDGREVEAFEGETILSLAKRAGIRIPTLCYLEKVLPIGSCRICVVEVEGFDKPITACDNYVFDGMILRTNTERLRELRRQNLELLLINHPLDCPICDRAGECRLQDLVYEYGLEKVTLPKFPPKKAPKEWATVAIKYFPSRCVLCQRCVRVCREWVGRDVLDIVGNGFDAVISPLRPDRCISCGECLSVCPVGALTENVSEVKGRVWQTRKVKTVCGYCGVGCNLTLDVLGERVIKVRTEDSSGPNNGTLCVKGRFAYEFVKSEDRLKKPLIRVKDSFVEVSWDDALSLIARRLQEIRDKFGPDSIGGLCSARCTNEENYLFQKFMRVVIGTNNIDHCGRLCQSPTVLGLATTIGIGAMTNSIEDISRAELILVFGSNTTETHPVIGMRIRNLARFKGKKLIVVDPRAIDLAEEATLFLQIKPATDIALINGFCNVIINEGLYDRDFVERMTDNFEEFKNVVKEYTPDRVEAITGVPRDLIIEASRMYAKAKPAAILYCMGITQHSKGTDNVKALSNLALLCGNIGKEGGGVNPLAGQNNVQGACDMGGLPDFYPGYQRVDVPEIRAKFETSWGKRLPEKIGMTLTEMMDAAIDGRIKAMYIMGENPLVTDPNLDHVEKALSSLNFLVVQDIFLTETAKFAHVILPAASFIEKDGTFTNTERKVQRVRKAISPPGEAKPDWEILTLLFNRFGSRADYKSPKEIFEEIRLLTPQYSGISYERLEQGGIHWPCPKADHPGTPVLHKDGIARGKGLFVPVDYEPPQDRVDEDYPFVLITGRDYYQYHSSTMTGRSKVIRSMSPEAALEVNPEDLERLGLKEGDFVSVESRRGAVTLKVRASKRVGKGTLFSTFHFPEVPINRLTGIFPDPECKITELKFSAVRLKRIS